MKKTFLSLLIILFCLTAGFSQSRSRATAQEKRDLLQILVTDKNFKEKIKNYEVKANAATKTTRIEKIALDGNKQPEYQITIEEEHLCGALANCPAWIYRKTGDGYEPLLFTRGRELLLEKTSTGGFRDLRSESGDTATTSYFDIYKYDGKKYQAKDCFKREYSDANSKPKVSRVSCQDLN